MTGPKYNRRPVDVVQKLRSNVIELLSFELDTSGRQWKFGWRVNRGRGMRSGRRQAGGRVSDRLAFNTGPIGRSDSQYFLNGKVAGAVQFDVPQRDLVPVGSAGDGQTQWIHPERFDGRQFDFVDPCVKCKQNARYCRSTTTISPQWTTTDTFIVSQRITRYGLLHVRRLTTANNAE